MIYEPQHLKTKKAMYDKRDKWLFRLAFFIWLVLFCIYGKAVSAVYPHAKSVLGFLGIMIGIIVITILYFLLVLFIFAFIRRGNPFIRRNNAIVKEYREHQNTELFVEKLLEIEEDPKNIINQITWYLNISIAFEVLGRDEECIALLRQVEEVSTGKNREYIQGRIRSILEKLAKNSYEKSEENSEVKTTDEEVCQNCMSD